MNKELEQQHFNKLEKIGIPLEDISWIMPHIVDNFVSIEEINSPSWIKTVRERLPTGFHETLHAVTVEGEGGQVLEESAKPNGNVRGFTRFFFNSFGNVDALKRRIASCMASSLGKELFKDYRMEGCAHDLSVAEGLSKYVAFLKRSYFNARSFMGEGLSRARAHVYSYGFGNLMHRAWKTTKKSV